MECIGFSVLCMYYNVTFFGWRWMNIENISFAASSQSSEFMQNNLSLERNMQWQRNPICLSCIARNVLLHAYLVRHTFLRLIYTHAHTYFTLTMNTAINFKQIVVSLPTQINLLLPISLQLIFNHRMDHSLGANHCKAQFWAGKTSIGRNSIFRTLNWFYSYFFLAVISGDISFLNFRMCLNFYWNKFKIISSVY